jgi:hypothetical protein
METLLVNLQILATIKQNERLGTEGGTTFEVYRPSMTSSFARRYRGESRGVNVGRLEQCVHHAIALLRSGGDEHAAIERHLRAAQGGIRNLIMTYTDDVATSARLARLIEAMSTCMAGLGLLAIA